MQAINALYVSSWRRGPQSAENDLTARSTPGQQQEIDSRRAASESPTVGTLLEIHAYYCTGINHAYARSDFHSLQRSGFRVSLR